MREVEHIGCSSTHCMMGMVRTAIRYQFGKEDKRIDNKGFITTKEFAQGWSNEVSWETNEDSQRRKKSDYRYAYLCTCVCACIRVYLCVYECACISLHLYMYIGVCFHMC